MHIQETFFNKEGAPLKCQMCGSEYKDFIFKVEATTNHMVCEESVTCGTCGEMAGYWAYGSWNPAFEFGERE